MSAGPRARPFLVISLRLKHPMLAPGGLRLSGPSNQGPWSSNEPGRASVRRAADQEPAEPYRLRDLRPLNPTRSRFSVELSFSKLRQIHVPTQVRYNRVLRIIKGETGGGRHCRRGIASRRGTVSRSSGNPASPGTTSSAARVERHLKQRADSSKLTYSWPMRDLSPLSASTGSLNWLSEGLIDEFAEPATYLMPHYFAAVQRIMAHADVRRRLGVLANADNAPDAARARRFGASPSGP